MNILPMLLMSMVMYISPVKSAPVYTTNAIEISKTDMYNIVMCTIAEAEGESELGQRYVIDTILNRVDSEDFPDTISEVVWQDNQFSGMEDERLSCCVYDKAIEELVREELINRTNYDTLYFRTKKYSKYGEPLFKEGNHYFSGIKPEEENGHRTTQSLTE